MVMFLSIIFLGLVLAGAAVLGALVYFGADLPDHKQLGEYEPEIVSRIHAGDGRLLTEYATETRVYVAYDGIPPLVVKAFLSAEDKNFFNHSGVDGFGVARAMLSNIKNAASGKRLEGASTITQQVAKNFLLSNEVSFTRKIREAILAVRIEKTFSKEKILELYLNEIYLGSGTYGIAAAALHYFDKPLDNLTIAEVAYLAALPKGPNNYHPVRRKEAALGRRNWVIGRMLADGYITKDEAKDARKTDLVVADKYRLDTVDAAYFTEEVRRELVNLYGEQVLYAGGLSVRTTLDPTLQEIAETTLLEGLVEYDHRHGWRGAIAQLSGYDLNNWHQSLDAVPRPAKMPDIWQVAVVLDVSNDSARIGLSDSSSGKINLEDTTWAQKFLSRNSRGAAVKSMADVLSVGDVIAVRSKDFDKNTNSEESDYVYTLQQIPQVDGAIVAMDPNTGRVLAMTGGISYTSSEFNRATQAMRQPGSAFKPFIYLAAMDKGYNPASVVVDAPIALEQGPGLPLWRPQNYTEKFYGPTTVRRALENSYNIVTIKLAQDVGVKTVIDYAKLFGIIDSADPVLSIALGTTETTLLRLTNAYAMLANGGKGITPTFIDRIQDRTGRTIFRHDARVCNNCKAVAWKQQAPPKIPDDRTAISDPRTTYQVVGMLEGVIQNGTGKIISELGRPIAGKTGTTNNNIDTWFIGFTPSLTMGVFVGFDEPATLGSKETGGKVAAPIFKNFMGKALKGKPPIPFQIPAGVRQIRVNGDTGNPTSSSDPNAIWEAFLPGTEPSAGNNAGYNGYGGNSVTDKEDSSVTTGTGGLY